MSMLFALALVAAQQPPELHREETTIISRLPSFPKPMAPAVVGYMNCLDGQMAGQAFFPETIEATFETAISHCASAREAARRQADDLLRRDPEWSDTARRLMRIVTVFDEIDASHRSRARILRERIAGFGAGRAGTGALAERGVPAGGVVRDQPPAAVEEHINGQTLNILRFPSEIEAVMDDYGNCVAASEGALPPSFPNPPVSAGGDCTPFRQAAASEADRLLQRATRLTARQRAEAIEANLQNVEAFMRQRPIPHPQAHVLPAAPGAAEKPE